jgi:hypothetical protein
MAKKVQLKSEMTFETSKLRRGLKQGEQMIKTSAGKMSSSLAAIGVGLGAGAGIAGLAGVADQFDRIGKLSTRFGIASESLQRMNLAAQLSGTNLETVARAMNKLVLATNDGRFVEEFQRLGINLDEFRRLDAEQQFLAFADAMNALGDQNERTAITLKLLGERAGDLIPLLMSGSDGIEEMTDGLKTLSDQGVRDIERFNDSITKLKTNLAGVAAEQLEGLIDVMTLVGLIDAPERQAAGGRMINPAVSEGIRAGQRAERRRLLDIGARVPGGTGAVISGIAGSALVPIADPGDEIPPDPFAAAFAQQPRDPRKAPGLPFGMGLSVAMGLQGMEAQSKLAMGAVQVRNTKFNEQKKDSLNLERITKATEDTAVALKDAL